MKFKTLDFNLSVYSKTKPFSDHNVENYVYKIFSKVIEKIEIDNAFRCVTTID